MPKSHVDAGSCPRCSTLHPALLMAQEIQLCSWPRKTLGPCTPGETLMKLLAPCFALVQYRPLQPQKTAPVWNPDTCKARNLVTGLPCQTQINKYLFFKKLTVIVFKLFKTTKRKKSMSKSCKSSITLIQKKKDTRKKGAQLQRCSIKCQVIEPSKGIKIITTWTKWDLSQR